jgi:hypothetical protein
MSPRTRPSCLPEPCVAGCTWILREPTHRLVDYACISYVDEHVGAILDTLQSSGMADNTLILFHADVSLIPLRCVPMADRAYLAPW